MDSIATILSAESLAVGYRSRHGEKVLASRLHVSLQKGELVCLLGPNGTGKTTLMRTLAGMHPPLSGSVLLEGKPVHLLKARQLAKKISVVLTDRLESGNLTAYSIVTMGRYPYTGWLGKLGQQDLQIINWAIDISGIGALAGRAMHHLSDGEQQKVMIARALAQDTPLILLDEPTAHLDLSNRLSVMALLRRMVRETGKTALVSTHDLDLALQSADKLWLMHQQHLQQGVPEDLVLNGSIEQVFRREGIRFDNASGTFRLPHPHLGIVRLVGEGAVHHWTRQALERSGFQPATGTAETPLIKIIQGKDSWFWQLCIRGVRQQHTSLEQLLHALRISFFQHTNSSQAHE